MLLINVAYSIAMILNLIMPPGASNFHFVADVLAQQRLAQRAFIADLAFQRIGLGRADHAERLFIVSADLLHLDARADAHFAAALFLDDGHVAQHRPRWCGCGLPERPDLPSP